MGNLWRNSIHLLLELNIFYFLIVLLYLDSGVLPSILGVILPYFFAVAIHAFLSEKLPSTYAAILTVAPALAVFSYLSGYSLGLSLIIGLFISFRGFMYFVEERVISTFTLLILSFIWMPFIYAGGALVEYPHGGTLMGLFGGQLILVVLLYSGTSVLNLKGNRLMQKRVISTTAIVFGVIAACSAVFATLGKWVITVGFSLFGQGLSHVFDFFARPIFFLLGLHDWTIKGSGPADEGSVSFEEEGDTDLATELVDNSEGFFDNPVVIAITVLLIITVLYVVLNKQKVVKKEMQADEEELFNAKMTKMDGSFFNRRKKQKPPEHQVRRLMFDLENLALKKNRGRLPNETLEEWLKRETSFHDAFMKLYGKVRYGELELTKNEVENCRLMAEEIRKVMKQWKKAS
jgi:hypothetical protein